VPPDARCAERCRSVIAVENILSSIVILFLLLFSLYDNNIIILYLANRLVASSSSSSARRPGLCDNIIISCRMQMMDNYYIWLRVGYTGRLSVIRGQGKGGGGGRNMAWEGVRRIAVIFLQTFSQQYQFRFASIMKNYRRNTEHRYFIHSGILAVFIN